MMRKVSIICPSYPFMHCGIADYLAKLAGSLTGKDFCVTIITSRNDKIIRFSSEHKASPLVVLPVIKRWDILGLVSLYRRIIATDPDIVHIQYQWWLYKAKAGIITLPFLFKLLGRKFKIVITFHDLGGPYLFPKAGRFRRLAIKFMASFCDWIISTNKKDAQDLINLLPEAANRISHIPTGPGIAVDGFDPRESESRPGDNQKMLLISNFGFMLPYKGLEDLLRAAKILIDKNYQLKLLAIGGYDIEQRISLDYFSNLKKLTRGLGIDGNVEWLGHRSSKEVVSLLKSSDICVLPFADGVSERRTSFITALACGLPIITTKLDNVPDKLVDRNNIIFVSPNKPEEIADAVEELAASDELRQRMSRAARALYEQEYTWPSIAVKTLKVYNDSLNEKIGH